MGARGRGLKPHAAVDRPSDSSALRASILRSPVGPGLSDSRLRRPIGHQDSDSRSPRCGGVSLFVCLYTGHARSCGFRPLSLFAARDQRRADWSHDFQREYVRLGALNRTALVYSWRDAGGLVLRVRIPPPSRQDWLGSGVKLKVLSRGQVFRPEESLPSARRSAERYWVVPGDEFRAGARLRNRYEAVRLQVRGGPESFVYEDAKIPREPF